MQHLCSGSTAAFQAAWAGSNPVCCSSGTHTPVLVIGLLSETLADSRQRPRRRVKPWPGGYYGAAGSGLGSHIPQAGPFKSALRQIFRRYCMTETIRSQRPGPCKGCPGRVIACSDHCKKPEYLAWKEEQETIRRNKRNYQCPVWKHGDRDPMKR